MAGVQAAKTTRSRASLAWQVEALPAPLISTLSALKPGFLLNSGKLRRQQKALLEPRRVLARPRKCTQLHKDHPTASISPHPHSAVLMFGGTVAVISSSTGASHKPLYWPSSSAWLCSIEEGLKMEPSLGWVGGEPEKGLGARERKSDSLVTLSCSHEGCQKRRSSWNKTSGAVLPVALLPVMTLCLFTLASCTTSILYNRS